MVSMRQRGLALLEYYIGVRRGADGENGVQKEKEWFCNRKDDNMGVTYTSHFPQVPVAGLHCHSLQHPFEPALTSGNSHFIITFTKPYVEIKPTPKAIFFVIKNSEERILF